MKNKEAMKKAAEQMLQKLENIDMDNIESINIQLIMSGNAPKMKDEDYDDDMSAEDEMKAAGKRKVKDDEEEEA